MAPSLESDPLTEVKQDTFGSVVIPETGEKKLIRRYTLKNSQGMKVQVINYGALVNSISVPDMYNRHRDVVLGFHDGVQYAHNQECRLAGVLGRVAGKVNYGKLRIADEEFYLTRNDNRHHMHGGNASFDRRVWYSCSRGPKVIFGYCSPEGEEGYPGNLIASVAYSITEENGLLVEMSAVTSSPTCVNLSNNFAFNLAGHEAGPEELFQHYVTLNASHNLDKYSGSFRRVSGLMDLRTARKMGRTIYKVRGGGYDHTFSIFKQSDGMNFAGRVFHPPSGRAVELFTDRSAVRLYTHRWLPDKELENHVPLRGKFGATYEKYGGLSLLTSDLDTTVGQYPVLFPGEEYKHTALYRFVTYPPIVNLVK